MTPQEKKRSVFAWIGAFALVMGCSIGGIVLFQERLPEAAAAGLFWLFAGGMIGSMAVNSVYLVRRNRQDMDKKAILAHMRALRDEGEEAWDRVEKELTDRCRITDGYTVFMTLLALGMSLLLNQCPGMAIVPLIYVQGLILRFGRQGTGIPENQCADPEEFPLQYALARKAQAAVGNDLELRILHEPLFRAAIALDRNRAYLQLGAALLSCMTREELYQIMLHEFAHLGNAQEVRYDTRGKRNGTANLFFGIVDTMEGEAYVYYSLFASQKAEKKADDAVRAYGDPQTAANGLAKLAYYEYYAAKLIRTDWDQDLYEQEEPPRNLLSRVTADFQQAVEENRELARSFLEKELPMRVSSHPLTRQRIAALGLEDVQVRFPEHSDDWGREMKRVLEKQEELLWQGMQKTFAQDRQREYLDRLETIESWQKAGQKLSYEATRDVLDALFALDRFEAVIRLSRDFAASGADRHERCHAIFLEGLSWLRLGDAGGIEVLYEAMETNRNYLEDGVSAIADFCRYRGMEEELNRVRAYADEISELSIEHESVLPLRKTDDLEPGPREDPVFRENLEVIRQAAGESLRRVLLVKKTQSAWTYHYIYLLELAEDLEEEKRDQIFHTVFMHLDKQEEQYDLGSYQEDSGKPWLEKRPGCQIWPEP